MVQTSPLIRRAILPAAACLGLGALTLLVSGQAALAQFPPPPGQEQRCQRFIPLREEMEKRGKAVQSAMQRKVPPQEACRLIRSFAENEAKILKFVQEDGSWCGFPPEALQQVKTSHANTLKAQQNACAAAAQVQRAPPQPTLGDVLGTSRIPDASTTRSGRGGTFDTLSGSAIGK